MPPVLRVFRNRRLPLLLAALFAGAGLGAGWHAVHHNHIELELRAALTQPAADHIERPESVGHGTPAVLPCVHYPRTALEPVGRTAAAAAVLSPISTLGDGQQACAHTADWRLAPKQSPPTA